jgi:glycosyltransferase involved in cell wall biosynthesis
MTDARDLARTRALQQLGIDRALSAFDAANPELTLSPVVALVCAYEEEDNIGAVLEKIPSTACGLAVTTLVVVDGGEDGTAAIAEGTGVPTVVLPVNMGHGVALRVGYGLCVDRGATYVVTLDADGQNDPAELATMLEPLVHDEADFVVASRRLGVDHTVDRVRQLGVVCFAGLINALTRSHLTDSSNGYRALRVTMLADVVDHLEQDQYQTAELLITALRRGWRVTERPTVWYPRASGSSKKGSNLYFGFRYAAVIVRTWLKQR